jgi:hypothetical protein
MLIANQAGWELRNRTAFEAEWDGGELPTATRLFAVGNHLPHDVASHFGCGIITWHVPFLFRTPPGYNLLVRGPANSPKDGIAALEGIVETDWSFATFTMNWKLTRPHARVRFEAGEVYCRIVPQERGLLEAFTPQVLSLDSEPEMLQRHSEWAHERHDFLVANAQRHPGGQVSNEWQKHYFHGTTPGATKTFPKHQTSLKLRAFDNLQRSPSAFG